MNPNPWAPGSSCAPARCVAHAVPPVRPARALRRTAGFARELAGALRDGDGIARPETLRLRARALLDALGVRLETPDGAVLSAPRAPRAQAARGEPGGPAAAPGTLVVANHISWLDAVALPAVEPVTLLAKREVGEWPVVGPMVRRAGTHFIDRGSLRELPGTVEALAGLLRAGRSVAVFPEGITHCSAPGGRFRPAAFQAALDAGAPVRPVTIGYEQAGVPSTVAAFVGEDGFAGSLHRVLTAGALTVRIRVHPPLLPVPGVDDRRSLARRAQALVRETAPARCPGARSVGSLPAATDPGLRPAAAGTGAGRPGPLLTGRSGPPEHP
ncbi:1-acyl-sn-glycerol-3-phosphate acyltransferase [Streptomyces sp. F63]|uniref:lysophospholipid acyltransferase family protein n=1 Tax=Streptomyces sp. F63 TaxID=2824887 RepID=UPI001B381B76|nr:lysophospholipid acyltransferase family protein [Streptomyces sp. F63]MBQ0985346.1 1-acyl-sn-glycerol-3-phosphate acyltransferase [Streptomyces sp. F63]